jgi:hypothetical protein
MHLTSGALDRDHTWRKCGLLRRHQRMFISKRVRAMSDRDAGKTKVLITV